MPTTAPAQDWARLADEVLDVLLSPRLKWLEREIADRLGDDLEDEAIVETAVEALGDVADDRELMESFLCCCAAELQLVAQGIHEPAAIDRRLGRALMRRLHQIAAVLDALLHSKLVSSQS